MADRVPMTHEGYQRLKEELKHAKTVERPEITKAIEVARAHGDLSENAEYHAAREKQSFIEGRIKELESKLAIAEVIDPKSLSGPRIVFGATVSLLDCESEEKTKYQIVGADEADIRQGKVSITAPMARAMIGKEKGDAITVRTPKGEREYEILGIEFV